MTTPGLLLATSHLLPDAPISSETFDHWYDTIHIPDVLAAQGGPPLALHYTNVDPSAKWTHLVAYRLPDISWVGSDGMKNIPKEWNGWEGPNGTPKRGIEYAEIKSRAYEQVQVYEGPVKKPERGTYLVSVGITIAEEIEQEYDEWMRKQHLPMVSMIPVFRRCTRYSLLPAYHASGLPKIFILSEYDEPPSPHFHEIVRGTDWSKRVMAGFKSVDKNGWQLSKEFGKAKKGMNLS